MQFPCLRRERDDRGETLVELLVAVAILGIAAVAIMTGLLITVTSSDQNRKSATNGAYVRSWAEAIQTSVDDANKLNSCSEYLKIFEILEVENPDLDIELDPNCVATPVSDRMQKLDLRVKSTIRSTVPVVESLVVFVREPCNAAGEAPCAP